MGDPRFEARTSKQADVGCSASEKQMMRQPNNTTEAQHHTGDAGRAQTRRRRMYALARTVRFKAARTRTHVIHARTCFIMARTRG